MATTISLGWFLSMAHTLYHAISMPIISSFSMIFMNFIMPSLLIACINAMDEIKRLVVEKSTKKQLQGIRVLFPQMAETYLCSRLSAAEAQNLFDNSLMTKDLMDEKRTRLEAGMLLEVMPGSCFPVDCLLVSSQTMIDASLLTGEPHQYKKAGDNIPSGAINMGQKVRVYALKNAYNSTVNTLLFRSNRAKETRAVKEDIPTFVYLYSGLIVLGLLGSVLVPIALGVATTPLVLQNLIGILFSVCPCTLAIGHQLPPLISLHHRNSKGIHLQDEGLLAVSDTPVHTLVFDKTGTLTTGNSLVESSDIPSDSPLWQRIYLLEKALGREHPLAKAIQKHYEATRSDPVFFDEVRDPVIDPENRGLAALVQGKKIQIGSFEYLRQAGIRLPELQQSKIEQGFSAVCVAEEGCYQGVIYVKHEVRKGVKEALARLKREGKRIIMLTGDNYLSAKGFNAQLGSVFDESDIVAGQTPQDKERFLAELMQSRASESAGFWFVGDGLNDAPCCRMVSEKGGLSCAMESNNKSVFFTDITLNGSLDYLFLHQPINQFLHQSIWQNKGILICGSLVFLAFIACFSSVGMAVSPLIPTGLMVMTTFYVVWNSYRNQLHIDVLMDKKVPWVKKVMSSQLSMGILLAVSALLAGLAGVLSLISVPVFAALVIAMAYRSDTEGELCLAETVPIGGMEVVQTGQPEEKLVKNGTVFFPVYEQEKSVSDYKKSNKDCKLFLQNL